MAPTAAALLAAWEIGATEPPVDRAPSLLGSLGLLAEGETVARMTVGRCDAHLFRLRRSMFGEALEAIATCPDCRAEVELLVSLADLQPPVTIAEAAIGAIEADGYRVSCRRLPDNEDLRALADLGEAAGLEHLLERCLVEARAPDGAAVAPGELPQAVAEAVAEALAASDPGAHVPLGVVCPCGREWVDVLDIRTILWTDLTDWVGRTLTEVHQLARAYGWSESDILAMSPWRRRWYLEAGSW